MGSVVGNICCGQCCGQYQLWADITAISVVGSVVGNISCGQVVGNISCGQISLQYELSAGWASYLSTFTLPD